MHPSDLDHVEGRQGGRRLTPGASPGTEGVGRVAAVGAGVTIPLDARVLLPLGTGCWRDRLVLSAHRVRVVPHDADPLQLCMAQLAPLTAHLLLSCQPTTPGEWVVQNAGNGAIGKLVVQLARERGLRSVSLVRHATGEREVRAAGGDVALVSHPDVARDVHAYTSGATLRLGFDAVAGPDTQRLAACLGVGGVVWNYGSLSRQPCQVDALALTHRELHLRGMWWTTWFHQTPAQTQAEVLDQLVHRTRVGEIRHAVAATYPLDRVREAVQHARAGGRDGRVLLTGEAYDG